MEKYHKMDICPVEEENERDENYKADNPQIYGERTKDNYHTFARYCSYTEFINQRIDELNLPTKPRKDAVLMCSFVIGSDGEFFKGLSPWRREQLFDECTRYFADRYGKENIISAVVHEDETTPHLHLNLIPVNNGRLCCKKLFNREELTKLQTDFYEKVGRKYGLQRGKEGSQAKHLTTTEFKAKKIIESAEQQAEITKKQARQQAENYLQCIHSAVEAESEKPIPKKKKQTEEEIKTLRTENAAYKEHLRIKNEDAGSLFRQLQESERKNKGNDTAFRMVTDMIDAYPDEFDALLKKSREKKSGGNVPTPHASKNQWTK